MNVEIGTETPIFLFWEYLFRNIGILSLQCGGERFTEVPFLLTCPGTKRFGRYIRNPTLTNTGSAAPLKFHYV